MLLKQHWVTAHRLRSPTSPHREGKDRGKRYRCVVYYICALVYWAFSFNSFKPQLLCALEESLTVVTERDSLNAERRMTDSLSWEESLHELELNNLNINLYIRLNYGAALEHFKYSAWKLYGALWCFCGFRGAEQLRIIFAQDRIWIGLVSPICRKCPVRSRYQSWVGIGSMHPTF